MFDDAVGFVAFVSALVVSAVVYYYCVVVREIRGVRSVPFAAAAAASWCVRFVAFVPFAAASAVFKVSSILLLIVLYFSS